MPSYQALSAQEDQDDNSWLIDQLRTKLPPVMREQLNLKTQARAYFLLSMLSDDECVQHLRAHLQQHYPAPPSSKSPIEQALTLITQLQKSTCNSHASFKFRLPSFLGEYPIHSQEINLKISQFNQLIERYHAEQALDAEALNQAYQDLLIALAQHHTGCNIHSLWQLLQAMAAWSTQPIEELLQTHPSLLAQAPDAQALAQVKPIPLPTQPVNAINQAIAANKSANGEPFTTSFNYKINEAGRLEQSQYLLLNGFALKPGGHADALTKSTPDFLPWAQWKGRIRRQLSQLITLPPDDEEFFDWLQTVLQRLGVQFMALHNASHQCYLSPFLNSKTVNELSEEMILRTLQEQCEQTEIDIEAKCLPIISRYLMRFLQNFQFHRGQALGIGANWGGVVNDSNEAGADAFRFNDTEWGTHFKNLSLHRQGPAEARMDASIGIKYEFQALISNFQYMTQLQPSEYKDTLYNALVDNLVATLFPEPPYFENTAYNKYKRHHVVTHGDDGMQHIEFFYQPDPQGTYFQAKTGDYKQTPLFRKAGSLEVDAFPRDTGSGESFQSLSVANPLWPLQLQYAQAASSAIRGHLVYNPIGPDEFIPDTFYGQIIRESEHVFVPFIGVIPKNFDGHFEQVELCASFVVRMLQSSRLMTYSPTFSAYYSAVLTRFLPPIDQGPPLLPQQTTPATKRKWRELDQALQTPERTATDCHQAFMSLFKELIYSLYALTKEESDWHYYFVELTTSPDTFTPQNRATCERLIRELTTLKLLATPENEHLRQQYELTLNYLRKLTDFFYPLPHDETAKAIAKQARIHAQFLLEQPNIKAYFTDLSEQRQANISTKVSPGLMHDAIKYQRPSPEVSRDFYHRRHATNFPAGYRDLDGGQIVRPSTRETLLDKLSKTGGALLPLTHRNRTIFSLLTQPLSQAYIQGHQAYLTQEQYKILWAIWHGIGGFLYGAGLGLSYAVESIPRTIYKGWFAPAVPEHHTNHALAISSAPSNVPGLRIAAIMNIRDHLLQCMASMQEHALSKEQLINLLLAHVKQLHPALLTQQLTTEEHYKQLLLETFPLTPSEWSELFAPVIEVGDNVVLQHIINQHALQIDCILIHALYECLTTPQAAQAPKTILKAAYEYLTTSQDEQNRKAILKAVIDKHKLKDPQTTALAALANYYQNNPADKKQDMAQYRFQGPTIKQLKTKERKLLKIQTWMHNALDNQWALEGMLAHFMEQYRFQLNQDTLKSISLKLPDSIKVILHELISNPGNEKHILSHYQLDEPLKAFLIQCSHCYKTMAIPEEQREILQCTSMHESPEASQSIKAREHEKLVQFMQREWRHQFLPIDAAQSMINDLKKQMDLAEHPALDEVVEAYKTALENIASPQAFDVFYTKAQEIQHLQDWVNVTMNAFVNSLLDQMKYTQAHKITNPLNDSQAAVKWLNHLMGHQQGVRALLAQQIEQAPSFDDAAWRCQYLLNALEASQPNNQEPIPKTGMQKLLRLISQNTHTLTTTGEQKAKKVPIAALCEHSITMQHALERVRKKVPGNDFVRAYRSPSP